MTWRVPLTTLTVTEADVEAVLDCLRGGWLTMGPRTKMFEDAFAGWSGSPHAVSVSSGTAALHLALAALRLEPGSEVIVPSMTFVATAAAARYVSATPVLCDVVSPTYPLIDVDDVERRITPRTSAVVAVHMFGYAVEMAPLRALCDRHGLALVEDVAQGIGATDSNGARVGSLGDIATFSFFSKKQLSIGEGGMVTADNDELAERVRLLRSHAMTSGTWDRHQGHAASYDVVDVGFNFRLDEIRSAIPFSDGDVQHASHFAFPLLLADRSHRDAFRDRLRDQGVQTTWYPSLSELSDYRPAQPMIQAEEMASRHCALPLSASLSRTDREIVIEAVRSAAVEIR
jgi:dTDP-4-amino-4,6-dideoxygalactose transaminase